MATLTLTTSGNTITLTAAGESITFLASGELNAAANVGGGDAEVFRDKVGSVLNFRTITGTGSIVVAENGDVVEISAGAGGEINLGANVGGGADVFRDKIGVTLNFRTLVGLAGTTVVVNGDVVEITAGGTGDVVGPGSATDEAIARFDEITGKLLQNSLATVDDSGNFATPGTVVSNGGTFTAASAVSVALIAKGFAAQSAALQEWRNSADTVLASMTFVSAGTRLTTRSGDRLELESGESDSASAIGFVQRTTNTLSTSGSRHTVWENNGTDLLSLSSESSGVTLKFHRTSGGDAPVIFVRSTNQLAINMSGVANNFDFAFVSGGVFVIRGGGVDRGQIAVVGNGIEITSRGSTAPFAFVSSAVIDSATVPGFRFRIPTAGTQLHTLWQTTASNTTILSLNRTGILDFTTTDALGGGAAPTLGTIGGTGPTAAAQSKWLKIKINGTDHWLPAWV